MNRPGFWRKEVIEPALNDETKKYIDAQLDVIRKNPNDARAYYQLGLLYRMHDRPGEALKQFFKALELDPKLTDTHVALGEMCVIRGDYDTAWFHARVAAQGGNRTLLDQLERYPNLTIARQREAGDER